MRNRIAGKLSYALGIVFVLSLAGLTAYHLVSLYHANLAEGQRRAQLESQNFANEISAKFDETTAMLTTLRSTLLRLQASGITDREYVVELMRELLADQPDLLGVYTLWEPDAFDGRDADYRASNEYHDDTGRFLPYVVRTNGQIQALPLHSYDNAALGNWYLTPKSSRQFALMEPFWYNVNGVAVPMTSLVFPILDEQGSFEGIVGADIELDFVQQKIENIAPLGGYAAMITAERNYLAHGQDRSKQMQPYENPAGDRNPDEWFGGVMSSMYTAYEGGGSAYRLYYPIAIENELWHLEIVIPKNHMLTSFHAALRDSLLISALALAVALVLMTVLIRRIVVRNINRVIGISSSMANGDMGQRLDIATGDEFEVMAGHFNRMIESRLEAEEQIRYQATHDMLTQLYNRKGFYEYIREKQQSKPETLAALLFIDLDRFKLVNDTLNHESGDEVLIEVSKRLSHLLLEKGELFRFGGDEFIVILDDIAGKEEVVGITEQILEAVAVPFRLSGRQFYLSASIGISMTEWSDFRDGDRKIKEADTAMYLAKREKNTYKFYDPIMCEAPSKEIALENDMHRAMENDQFMLVYQPKVELATNRIYGVEALIRWQHPELGTISPLEFIPIAEKTGFINTLGEWVIRTACRQTREWDDMGLPPLTIAVNISMIQFQHESLLKAIKDNIDEARIRPERLELELTESVFMNNPARTLALLNELKDMGVQISLDDFGTGYSSLSYLKNIPLDYLKLDKSFISNITVDQQEQMIVKSVIVIAHNLGLKVVTEGVETNEQYDILKEHQCDGMQGYYFSPPLPAERFLELYQRHLAAADYKMNG